MNRNLNQRRVLAASVVAILGLAVSVFAIRPVGATEPADAGWWWAGRPSAMFPGVLRPPSSVPEGGLYVAGGPNGPSGISALRFQVDPGAEARSLTLTIADVTGTVAITACPAKSRWQDSQDGGWDQRPEADCQAATVTGALSADKSEVSIPVSSLQRDNGVIDVVLLPGVDPATNNPAVFSASFKPLGPQAVTVSEPTETSSSSTEGSSADVVPAGPAWSAPLPVDAVPSTAPATETRPLANSNRASTALAASAIALPRAFAYPAVLALPLLLLCVGSYFGWALSRPVTVTGRYTRSRS